MERGLGISAYAAAPTTQPWLSGRRWMEHLSMSLWDIVTYYKVKVKVRAPPVLKKRKVETAAPETGALSEIRSSVSHDSDLLFRITHTTHTYIPLLFFSLLCAQYTKRPQTRTRVPRTAERILGQTPGGSVTQTQDRLFQFPLYIVLTIFCLDCLFSVYLVIYFG